MYPLNIKSHFSLLQSTIKIDKLCEKLNDFGYNSAGLQDIYNCSSLVEFYKTAKQHNLKPILGSELWAGDKINLICKNKQGWKNLIKLTSISNSQQYYRD